MLASKIPIIDYFHRSQLPTPKPQKISSLSSSQNEIKAGEMVSDEELIARLREFLRISDLTTTTTAIVRRRLEEDFGVDLTARKAFIREQIDIFLQSQLEEESDGDGDGAGVEGDEEEDEEGEEDDEGEGENDVKNAADGSDTEVREGEEGGKNGKQRKKKPENKQGKDTKRRGGGFTKLCSLSPQLQEFLGVPELARTEVVRQLWAYIREHDLQDPENKRNIRCDQTLRSLFRVDVINMFQMNKVLSKHIWPLEDAGAANPVQKENKQKKEREEGSEEDMPKEKKRKGGNTGFLAPIPLSDALMKFIGTGESALSRADVVKRIWDYIKKNNLQDPADKRRIICDEKLKELFDVDSFHGFTVPKLLTTHFIKAEQ